MKSKTTIASLKYRISLCTMHDVVIDDGGIRLTREKVFGAWASIEAKRGSMFAPDGVTVKESRDTQSHLIVIRYRHDFVISSAAWIYEERRISEPRWYKILAVEDDCGWWKLKVRLVEKSDFVSEPTDQPPANPFLGLPQGIKL